MPSPDAFSPTKHHRPALDGLRAIAVLLVMWTHVPAAALGGPEPWLRAAVKPGYLGVDIFFVLSGFLITRILLADKLAGVPVRWFLLRRLVRIFPIYYITLAVIWAIDPTRPELPWAALYLSNVYFPFHGGESPLRHTWSLAVEEHFYMLWPWVVYGLSVARSRLVALGVLVPFALFASFAWVIWNATPQFAELIAQAKRDGLIADHNPKRLVYTFTAFRMLSLAVGALFAYHERAIDRRPARAAWLAAAALVAGEVGIHVVIPAAAPLWWPPLRLISFHLVSAGTVLGVIAIGDLARSPLAVLRTGVLRAIGRISYALYLFHLPIFTWLAHGEGATPRRAALAIAVSFAAAGVSYVVIEKPMLRWAGRFRG